MLSRLASRSLAVRGVVASSTPRAVVRCFQTSTKKALAFPVPLTNKSGVVAAAAAAAAASAVALAATTTTTVAADSEPKAAANGPCEELLKPASAEKELRALIRAYPDFPKKGILFQDIFPIFQDHKATATLTTLLQLHIAARFGRPDVIVGLDARGFLLGPMLAQRLGCRFAPIRKQGKLPGKTLAVSYEKEYGTDTFELQADAIKDGDRVVIFDDLLATGGTMAAAARLVQKGGGEVQGCFTIIELSDLEGSARVPAPCYTMLKY